MPRVEEIAVADAPELWSAAGFSTDGSRCRVGAIDLRLGATEGGRGLVGWSLSGLTNIELDGLPTVRAPEGSEPLAAEHPNAVMAIDHLVVLSPQLDRTTAALRYAGLDLRRVREEPTPGGAARQAFFRAGEAVVEVIEQPRPDGTPIDPARPAKLWGLAFEVSSLDRCVRLLGDRLGSPRDAVQPGRRIATLRSSAGLGVPIAFMTPRRSRSARPAAPT